jgi:molecular chaperone GrpE (heat shock protein)
MTPKIAKWPFFVGDALLLGVAGFVCTHGPPPLAFGQLALAAGCVAGGVLLGIAPFLLEYRALIRVAEAGALTTVVAQIQNLESIATQISGATGRWQNIQEESEKTAASAKVIADRMAAEVKGFTEFMQRVNDSERSTLRLEVEKLRRGENDWLQVLVRLLDHVYAVYLAAVRSGQPNLVDQLTQFQNACRDAARRVGLVPFVASETEPFDAQRHKLADGDGAVPEGATVAETVATGYALQGRLLRPALVRLGKNVATAAPGEPVLDAAPVGQSQLPLEAGASAAQ